MTIDLGLLIGLISIALALFFGLWGFRKGIASELSAIKEAVIAIRGTVEKTWDLVVVRFGESSGTVERELENLGTVKITAEPGEKETSYLIEVQKPILAAGMVDKLSKETGLAKKEVEMFGKEPKVLVLSHTRLRMLVPSSEPKLCTEYITLFLKWLDSTYFESLGGIQEFEEPILT